MLRLMNKKIWMEGKRMMNMKFSLTKIWQVRIIKDSIISPTSKATNVHRYFDPKSQVKQNTITLVYSDSQLSTQHYGVRVKMFGSTHESV